MGIYDTHKPKSGGGQYLKLNDGDTVKVRIASDPIIFESIGEREGKQSISTRYGWLVWNQDEQAPQILHQSATFFKSIAGLAQNEEWGDPQGYNIQITRRGANFNDTTYVVTPSTNREPLTIAAQNQLRELDLIKATEVSTFNQHVMWLSDFEDGNKPKPAAAAAEMPPAKPDPIIDDVGEEPINLDDIPF